MVKLTGWLGVMTMLVSTAWAQQAIEPVLDHVPHDAAAVMVVPNLEFTGWKVDQLLDEQLGQLIRNRLLPDGSAKAVTDRIAQLGIDPQLGQIDISGGLAVVLLKPDTVGMDIPAYVGKQLEPLTGKDTDAPEQKLTWPLAAMVPVAKTPDQQAGAITKTTFRGQTLYLGRVGSFLIVSPTRQAVVVLQGVKQPMTQTMSKDHRRLLMTSLIGLHVNNRVINPFAAKLIDTLDTQLQNALGESPSFSALQAIVVQKSLPYLRTFFVDKTAETTAVRFVEAGIVAKRLESFGANSKMAQGLASYKPSSRVIDRAARAPGFLVFSADAMASQRQGFDELSKLIAELAKLAVKLNSRKTSLDAAKLDSLRETTRLMRQQITALQISLTVEPSSGPDQWPLAATAWLEVGQARTFRTRLSESVNLFDQLMRQAVSPEQLYLYPLSHQAGQDIDRIDLKRVLNGADAQPQLLVRGYLAPVGQRQVVGAISPTDKTIARLIAQQAQPPVPAVAAGTAKALSQLRKNPSSVLLLHPGKFARAVDLTRTFLQPDEPARPPMFTGDVPVAISSSVIDSQRVLHTAFVPDEVLADAVRILIRAWSAQ